MKPRSTFRAPNTALANWNCRSRLVWSHVISSRQEKSTGNLEAIYWWAFLRLASFLPIIIYSRIIGRQRRRRNQVRFIAAHPIIEWKKRDKDDFFSFFFFLCLQIDRFQYWPQPTLMPEIWLLDISIVSSQSPFFCVKKTTWPDIPLAKTKHVPIRQCSWRRLGYLDVGRLLESTEWLERIWLHSLELEFKPIPSMRAFFLRRPFFLNAGERIFP